MAFSIGKLGERSGKTGLWFPGWRRVGGTTLLGVWVPFSTWFYLMPGIFLFKCFLSHPGPFLGSASFRLYNSSSAFAVPFFLGNPNFQAGICPLPIIQVLQDHSHSAFLFLLILQDTSQSLVCPGVAGTFPVILALGIPNPLIPAEILLDPELVTGISPGRVLPGAAFTSQIRGILA